MTTPVRIRAAAPLCALAALFIGFAVFAPAAEAKKGKLEGQIIGDAVEKKNKVEAPVLLSSKSAKKLKLRSPMALLVTKGAKKLKAPDPQGGGKIVVTADTLRAGDTVKGKAKTKGSTKKPMPKLKAKRMKIAERSSAYSVDELTAAVVALYQRVALLEGSLGDVIIELEQIKQQNTSLTEQVNSLLTQLTSLQSTLDSLPTAAQLQQALTEIAGLKDDLAALGVDVDGLEGQLNALAADVTLLCGEAIPIDLCD